ncbi:MAG: hypothetical protein K2Y22_04215 [Candidatus Obscuribacterales bacterium]|nr:hypothetical protein [Candidatus Obscuribacterales bacterium]
MSVNKDRTDKNKIRVSFILNPIEFEKEEKYFDYGKTIEQIILEFCSVLPVDLLVNLNGNPVPREYFKLIKPKAGSCLSFRAMPAGGKRTLNIIGGVVGLVGGGLGMLGALSGIGRLIFGGIASLGFGMLKRGLTPPPRQFTPAVSSVPGFSAPAYIAPEPFSPGIISQQNATRDPLRPSISGSQNQSNPYGVIPKVLGLYKMFPPLAAQPYTELVGDDQYVRMLLCLGYGPVNVTDIKIGENLIVANPVYDTIQTVTGSSFEGIEYQLIQGYPDDPEITLFPNDVNEESLDLPLTFAGGSQTRTAAPDADQLSVDITFPNGLTQFFTDGSRSSRTVNVTVEYRATGSSDPWTLVNTISVTDNSTATVRRGLTWDVAQGDYDVRLTRTTADNSDVNIIDLVSWSVLRSIRNVQPFGPIKDQQGNVKGISLLAMRIKGTEQLQGTPNQISCLVESILPVFDGVDWNEEATSNPAWIYSYLFTGPIGKTRFSTDKMHTDSLMDWAENCDDDGRECNFILDSPTNRFELAKQVAAVGRAGFMQIDGKIGVVQDLAQAVPGYLFTSRNMWGFSRSWVRIVQPHALRVFFINPDANWQQDEAVVYDDGYTSANATIIEELQLPFVTNYEQAWKAGRYHLAALRLRPFTYEFYTDIENIQLRRGDLVRVNHDTFEWGRGNGRIKAVTLDNDGNAISVTLDSPITMLADEAYAVRISKADLTHVVSNVVFALGEQSTLIFTTPIPFDDPLPVVGDLFAFGLVGLESIPLVIKDIAAGPNFSAKITGVDYAPEIQDAPTGAIPPFTSNQTRQGDLPQQVIPKPILINIRSDETVLVRQIDGTDATRIAITLAHVDNSIGTIQARFRASDSAAWTTLPPVNTPTNEISIIGVEDGGTYDIQIRNISRSNKSSEWLQINDYFVLGKLNPPPDVPTLTLSNGKARWSYPDAIKPPDFKGFYLSYNLGNSTNYATSIRAHDGILTVNEFDISNLPIGPKTIMVVAVDTAGNVSTTPAYIFVEQGDPIDLNLVEEYDFGAASYPGTLTGGTLDSGDLKADGLTDFWPTSDLELFYPSDNNALFWDAALYDTMVYATDPYFPDANQLPARMGLLFTVEASSYNIEYRIVRKVDFWDEDSVPFWDGDSDPFWDSETIPTSEWLPWPGYLDIPLDSPDGYQFRITTNAGTTQGVISRLIVQLDVPDIEQVIDSAAIADTGSRLTLTKTFRVIKAVGGIAIHQGTARSAEIVDRDATLGPLIELYDSSHVLTSGTIDAIIKGY